VKYQKPNVFEQVPKINLGSIEKRREMDIKICMVD